MTRNSNHIVEVSFKHEDGRFVLTTVDGGLAHCDLWADIQSNGVGDYDFLAIYIENQFTGKTERLTGHAELQGMSILQNDKGWCQWADEKIFSDALDYEPLGYHELIGSRRVA